MKQIIADACTKIGRRIEHQAAPQIPQDTERMLALRYIDDIPTAELSEATVSAACDRARAMTHGMHGPY